MYLRLKKAQDYEYHGERRRFQAGDWLDVPKALALAWISQGIAEQISTKQLTEIAATDCGIVANCNVATAIAIQSKLGAISFDYGEPSLVYPKTLIWDEAVKLRIELIPVGFSLLDKWDMVLSIASYKSLACSIGSPEEREQTKAIVHDLRIPYYDSRLIYAKRNKATRPVIERWRTDVKAGFNSDLSLLRAVYQSNALVLTVPITWTQGREAY